MEVKRIQQILGTIMYYARAVDMTFLVTLSTLASNQAKATQMTTKLTHSMLDYLAIHPNTTIRYHASDKVLNIHLDDLYLTAPNAKS